MREKIRNQLRKASNSLRILACPAEEASGAPADDAPDSDVLGASPRSEGVQESEEPRQHVDHDLAGDLRTR